MSCSPTPGSPIPLHGRQANSMQRTFLAQCTPLAAAIAVVIALAAGGAAAHTLDDGIPQTNGLRIDMAAGAPHLPGGFPLAPPPPRGKAHGVGGPPDGRGHP